MPENDITELQTLDIYQLTENQYAELLESSEFNPDALYMTPASNAVASVNGQTPDANGNVDTAEIWHGDEVGSLPVPINADQLQGHPASYFQPLLSAGSGISITSNVISSNVVTTTPTTTNGNIQSSNIIARKIGDVLFLSGYIVAASNQTFTGDSTVCFTVSERPSGNRFFTFQNYTSNGPIVYVAKLNASGNVVFNNTITVATTYLFFNAALPL